MLNRLATISTSSQFDRIDPSHPVEEETMSGYNPKHYYPIKLGEVLHDRCKIIGKLGFGSASTVWLCRDLQKQHDYVAVKVYINGSKYHRELPIYEELNNVQATHHGRRYVRKMYDSFELTGPYGTHICLVHQPLGISLGELRELTPNARFGPELIRQTLRCILAGLQLLHKEVRVIHTGELFRKCPYRQHWHLPLTHGNSKDLQPSNMLLGIHDESVLARFEQYEKENPCPRKELDGYTIYLSRPMPFTKGEPSITDLSEGRFGDGKHTDRIMPNVYRAPEVILGIPWSYPVDIWGFAMVPGCLFSPKDPAGRYSEAHHLAEMISIMGPPPVEFLRQCGEKADKYWDTNGTWRDLAPIPDRSLEQMDRRTQGEEKQQFIAFMRKMLQWNPQDWQDSEEVYWDEWLLADLIESGEVVKEN